MDLTSIYDKNGNISSVKARFHPKLKDTLLTKWSTTDLKEAIFLENGGKRKLCSCGEPTKFNRSKYHESCSVSCGAKRGAKRGSDHHLSKQGVIQKRIVTNLARHGVRNVNQRKDVKERTKQTCLSKYGATSFLGSQHGKQVTKDAVQQKYGVHNVSLVPEIRQRATYNEQQNWLIQRVNELKDSVTPLFELSTWTGSKTEHQWRCVTCSTEFFGFLRDGNVPRCPICYPLTISTPHRQLQVLLDTLNISYLTNDRKILQGKELDVVIPDRKLAIEINGVYWHSELIQKPAYHLNKSIEAAKAGYRLIHIFSDELEASFNRLKNLFAGDKIPARLCTTHLLSKDVARSFLNEHHSSGAGPYASSYVGLFHKETLLAVMSFGKARWGNAEYELLRFATSKMVLGGASKLFKFWVSLANPKSVVTYSERRWNLHDAVYSKLGFEIDGFTGLDYWYAGNLTSWIRKNRMTFQKKKLIALGGVGETEHELAISLGLYRVWGCGNIRWIWKRPSMTASS